jgi:hypothetical protein
MKVSEQFDYLMQDTDKSVLKNLATMGEHLKELKQKADDAQQKAADAKKEYDYYASSVLPMEMFNAGVTKLELATGGTLQYERKFRCQPNKNDTDRKAIVAWLKEHGGEDLIKQQARVDGSQIERLREANVPYAEVDDINTNSLKAFLKDAIGANGGTVLLNVQDIPSCIHFQEVGEVSIS